MSEGQQMDLVWAVLMLVLVGSAFLSMRVPWGQAARMALAWVAIFGIALLAISQRDAFARLFGDMRRDLVGERQSVAGGVVRIPMAADGHFWVDVEINGRPLRLLVDSGATSTALSMAAAREAGIAVDTAADPVIIDTANGAVSAQRARVARLSLGPITASDLPIVVSPAFGDTSVLGMNFLSRLRGWRVEGRSLVLDANTNPELT